MAHPLRPVRFGALSAPVMILLGYTAVFSVAGCKDQLGPDTGTTIVTPPNDQGWCGVTTIFRRECVVCHNTADPQGALDLQADPRGALVGVTSAAYGVLLVDAGNPDNSLLMRKVDGTVLGAEGGIMPTTGLMGADEIDAIRVWIEDGATDACDTTPTGTNPNGYHPPGWADAGAHGMAAKFQDDDCQACHGDTFDGGTSGVDCASCHDVGAVTDWSTDCTFCHGDRHSSAADAPAPPQDIDDETDPAQISFPAHAKHLLSGAHPDWDCTQCHVQPTDVFSDGHLFDGDATAGRAELVFDDGLFSDGAYNLGSSSCSGGYCHSNGRASGWSAKTVAVDASLSCTGCHGGTNNPGTLSGRHGDHDEEGVDCEECHSDVNATGTAIDEPDLHVNGAIDLDLPAGITRSDANGTCSGSCHGEGHSNEHW